MKRAVISVILLSLMTIATTSQANPNHMNHHGNRHYGGHTRTEWLAPIVIGSAVGLAIVASRQQPVIVQQPQIVYPSNVPYGYHYEQILDANCNCYRLALVPN